MKLLVPCLLLCSVLYLAPAEICSFCRCFLESEIVICDNLDMSEVEYSLSAINLEWVRKMYIRNCRGVFQMSTITQEKFRNLERLDLSGENKLLLIFFISENNLW